VTVLSLVIDSKGTRKGKGKGRKVTWDSGNVHPGENNRKGKQELTYK
jgi:hypothetical protein